MTGDFISLQYFIGCIVHINLRSIVAVVVKLNSDLARGIFIFELFTTSPSERISKHDASILFVLRIADMTEPRSESSSR